MVKRKKSSKQDDAKLFAILAVVLSIIGFIIALVAKRDDKYVMYYAKQSLVLFILAVVISMLNSVLWIIPIIGWLVIGALQLGIFILWIVQIINAASGDMKETPLIGQYAKKINL